MNICIYSEFPRFLAFYNYQDAQKEKFIEGMTLLNKELNKPLY